VARKRNGFGLYICSVEFMNVELQSLSWTRVFIPHMYKWVFSSPAKVTATRWDIIT
jgi:hypothetical protein